VSLTNFPISLLPKPLALEIQPPYGGSPSGTEMLHSPDWVKFILDRPMSNAPGAAFNYSDGDAQLLSAIITRLTGMSALEYAKAKLFGPLGINEVFWASDPQGFSMGGYGLWLQPRDMAKIGYLYLRNGACEGQQLLTPARIDKIIHATIDMNSELGLRYSHLFWALPDKHVYMAVGAYGQLIMVFPDLGVVAVTTGWLGFQLGELANDISNSVKSDTAFPADPASAKLLADKIRDVSTDKPTPVGPAPIFCLRLSW
jgi:CubicO group peptidase (beta-lactamase class C family)